MLPMEGEEGPQVGEVTQKMYMSLLVMAVSQHKHKEPRQAKILFGSQSSAVRQRYPCRHAQSKRLCSKSTTGGVCG